MIYPIKLLMSFVVVLGFGYLGIIMSSVLSVRVKQIDILLLVLGRLEFNIGFLNMPIGDAMKHSASLAKGVIGNVFASAAKEINEGDVDPKTALSREMRRYSLDLCLNDEDKEVLLVFSDNLGKGDMKRELNNIKCAMAKLKVLKEAAEGETKRRGKLYKSVGFLIGLFIAIILF